MKYINTVKITDVDALWEIIRQKGIKILQLCENANINYVSFKKSMRGLRPFTVPEAYAISLVLGLTAEERDKIFFAYKVSLKATKEVI